MESPIGPKLIAKLLDRHGRALEFYARQWTSAGEDCAQEAFIELARQEAVPENIVAWLYRVVRNRALNAARASRRRSRHERDAAQLRHRQASEAAGEEEMNELLAALESMPPAERELIVLRSWSELSWQQIAELIGTSSSTAERRYVVALKQLREKLESSCQPNPTYPPNLLKFNNG